MPEREVYAYALAHEARARDPRFPYGLLRQLLSGSQGRRLRLGACSLRGEPQSMPPERGHPAGCGVEPEPKSRCPGRRAPPTASCAVPEPQMSILVVDDEPAVRSALRRALTFAGYRVDLAEDGSQALSALAPELSEPDAVLLDVLMPGVDGLEVCRRIRRTGSRVPVLMLTARDEVDDRVAGLDAGADDYLVKPFALEELLARIRALLRRRGNGAGEILRFADLELDPPTREVRRGGSTIELTRTEFSLLELFMLNPRQVLTRSIIFERVWGYDFGYASNSLDVYIGYLRRKTEADGQPRLIQTVRGVGYALREG